MRYPDFLKNGSRIGICAPSAGTGHKLDYYLESLKVLHEEGYEVIESESVRTDNIRSTTARKRVREFEKLLTDHEVDMIMFAAGGDYMLEIMPYVDFLKISKNPKWFSGMSDPTNLLFTTTILCDIATLYGFNGGSFELNAPKDQIVFFDYLKGNVIKQRSFSKYITCEEKHSGITKKTHPVKWVSKRDVKLSGRCIGGCFESIEKLIGTDFDKVKQFTEKYREDGIIWYFDVFCDSPYQFYLTLLQMKMAGYFSNCKGVLMGRVAYPSEYVGMTYEKALQTALKDIPYIMEMDIGHTNPCMTMINGALVDVEYKNGKGSISFRLE